MNLNEIAIFVKIVETGSFIGASGALDMPKSTVSSKLSSLEARLGVTLIKRTTRKLHITEAGKTYYEQCLKAIGQIMAAEEQVSVAQIAPHGLLRITAPVDLGEVLLPAILCEFSRKYPKVDIELILSDRTVDLVSEGIDIGIRAGELKDSSLISKKLGSVYFATFASPKYLKSNGTPKNPKELENHNCILYTTQGSGEWKFHGSHGSKDERAIDIKKHIVINDFNFIKSLAVTGVGIALLPTFLCTDEIKSGKLIRLLGNWKSNVRPVHFVYPAQKFVPPKLRAFIDVANDMIVKGLKYE